MIWTLLFAISIAQGLFLISLLVTRRTKNRTASRLISVMLFLMILTNFGYLAIRTDLLQIMPQAFGIPFGTIFLFGPLFYLYSKSVIDSFFRWKHQYFLHFIPYAIQLAINLPWLLAGRDMWVEFINVFLAGNLPINLREKIIYAIQDLHLFIYLFFTFRWVNSVKHSIEESQYLISFTARVKWLKALGLCFSLFLATVLSLYLFVLIGGMYNPVTNYVYTLITSGIIYFVAYKAVLNPELISPDFVQKYRSYMPFRGEEGEKYLQKLNSLMNDSKIFTNPDLKLSSLADELGLPSHQLSKLINEKFGKSFSDFINEYRVKEFINRLNESRYETYTIYGIALDVGFNSKSSFNSAFKKITGTTPSEYKKN